jgi:hypothetical protein
MAGGPCIALDATWIDHKKNWYAVAKGYRQANHTGTGEEEDEIRETQVDRQEMDAEIARLCDILNIEGRPVGIAPRALFVNSAAGGR